MKKAVEVEPFAVRTRLGYADWLMADERYAEAVEQLDRLSNGDDIPAVSDDDDGEPTDLPAHPATLKRQILDRTRIPNTSLLGKPKDGNRVLPPVWMVCRTNRLSIRISDRSVSDSATAASVG